MVDYPETEPGKTPTHRQYEEALAQQWKYTADCTDEKRALRND